MKNKTLIYVISIIVAVIFFAGASLLIINLAPLNECSKNKDITESSSQKIADKYSVKKSDKGLFFNITQSKPSSCYIINFYKTDFDKKIILDLNLSKYTNKCASNNSVIDKFSGEIEIEEPESIEINLDGERVYFRDFKIR